MTGTTDYFVAPALLRIRSFLRRRGLNVLPWANPAHVVEDLREVLRSQRGDEQFWTDLGVLVEHLGKDLQLRSTAPGQAVYDEWLDEAQRRELLDELRRAFDEPSAGSSSFADLTRRLGRPALAMLCLVAAAMLVGCGGLVERSDDGAATGGAGRGAATGGAGSGAAPSEAGAGGATGGAPVIILPPPEVPPFDCEERVPSLEEVLEACDVPDTVRESTQQCLDTLDESWERGLRQLLGCETCSDVRYHLDCLLYACRDASLDEEYSLDELLDHCVVSIYVGVQPS